MTPNSPGLNSLAQRSQAGDKRALAELVGHLQDPLHRSAIRMLADTDDALEATQEVLIRIITKLSTFKVESAFMTCAYKVASK